MPEPITANGAQQAPAQEAPAKSVLDGLLAAHGEPVDEEETEEQDEAEAEEQQDERKLNALLRKCESAFCRGNKGLLLSRVECGKYCHAVYVLRQEEGHKDRAFTSQLIFNRLAVHADSRRECDASELARMYKTVETLAVGDAWKKTLTVGKLIDLSPLVTRVDSTELYCVFDKSKEEQAKALFAWACGDGIKKPSREDIHNRVLELTDPAKYAEAEKRKAEKEAEKAQDKEASESADEEDEDDTPAPENLISTDAARPAAPDWKDVPDGMVGLYKEGVRQQPGHQADMMRDFAKEFVWTAAMVKGLIDGIASSEDAEAAQEAMQVMVDTIGDEYGIYPASEVEKEAA
jgi:hypothetical protein